MSSAHPRSSAVAWSAAVLLIACAPRRTTDAPRSEREAEAPGSSTTVDAAAESPEQPPPPAPAGASLTVKRTPCLGACPNYEVTLFESGVALYDGREFVTVVGHERVAVDPATVAALIREAEGLFARKDLPAKPTGCASDSPALVLSLQRGEQVDSRWISASCTATFENDTPDRARALLRRLGFDYDAMVAAEHFAERVELAVPTEPWVDDPACRDLRGTLLSPPLEPSSDTGLETRRSELEEWMIDRIRRTSSVSLRIRTPLGADTTALAHRDRLVARGVPPARIVIERMRFPTVDYSYQGDELTIGPSHCFAAARAAEHAVLEAEREPRGSR